MQLSFTDPLLEGLYTNGCRTSDRYPCPTATRRAFFKALSWMRVAENIAELLALSMLECQMLDPAQSLVSVKVDSVYRLECSCQEANGVLIGFVLHRLCS